MTSPPVRGSAGFTVIETVVALLLAWLLTALALGTLARQRTLQADLARRGEVLAMLRITRSVLGHEIRRGDGSMVIGADTLALRAFRGVALVCPIAAGAADLIVHVQGMRAPEPDKDSVQVVAGDGAVRVFGLAAREVGGTCASAPGMPVERWRLTGPAPESAVLARYFERGSYHLSGAALRYRRGDGGRQPLTPEVLRAPPSGFGERAGRLTVELFASVADGPERVHTLSLAGPGVAPGGT